jgi:hypothetical protein
MTYTFIVNGKTIALNHRQFTQAVSDGIRAKCNCGDCLICQAVRRKREINRYDR